MIYRWSNLIVEAKCLEETEKRRGNDSVGEAFHVKNENKFWHNWQFNQTDEQGEVNDNPLNLIHK